MIPDDGYMGISTIYGGGSKEEGLLDYHPTICGRLKIVNGGIKPWCVLTLPFRHERNLHGICFYAVANIAQLGIIGEEPLFQV